MLENRSRRQRQRSQLKFEVFARCHVLRAAADPPERGIRAAMFTDVT